MSPQHGNEFLLEAGSDFPRSPVELLQREIMLVWFEKAWGSWRRRQEWGRRQNCYISAEEHLGKDKPVGLSFNLCKWGLREKGPVSPLSVTDAQTHQEAGGGGLGGKQGFYVLETPKISSRASPTSCPHRVFCALDALDCPTNVVKGSSMWREN